MKREYIMVVAVLLLVVVVGIFVYVDTDEALVGEATADPPPPEPAPATSDRVRHINDILYARSRPLASSDYARASRIKIDAPDTKKKYTLYRNTYSDGRTAWADAKKAAGNRPIISFQVGGNLRNPSVSYQIQDQNSVTREVKAVNTIPLPSSDAEQTSGFKDGQAYFQETIGDDDYRVYCSEDGACHRYFYDTARNGYYPLVAEDAKKSIPGLDALEQKAQTHARNYRSVKVRDEIVVVQCEGERCRGYKQLESGKLERLNEDDVKKYQANIAPLERELQAFAASAAAQKAAEVESNAYFSKLDEFVNVPDLRDSRKFGDLSDDEKEHVRLLRAAKAADDRTEDEEDKTNVERAKAFISGKFAGVKRDEGVKAADKAVSAQRAAVDATQKTITDLEARQTKGEKLSNPEKKQLADAKKQLKRQAKELDELAAKAHKLERDDEKQDEKDEEENELPTHLTVRQDIDTSARIRALFGSTGNWHSLSNALIGEHAGTELADDFDRWFSNTILDQDYVESQICREMLDFPQDTSDLGVGTVETDQGQQHPVASIQAERVGGLQALLCEPNPDEDAEDEFICPGGKDSSGQSKLFCSEDGFCYKTVEDEENKIPAKGYLHKISWGVTAPTDEKLTPYIDDEIAVKFNVKLGDKDLYNPGIDLKNGDSDGETFAVYTTKDYHGQKVCIDWISPPRTRGTSGNLFRKDTGEDLPNICNDVVLASIGEIGRAESSTESTTVSGGRSKRVRPE